MCQYSGINDAQRYTQEESTPEEIERQIRNIIKISRDEELKLKIPMFENGSCPEVTDPSFCHYHMFRILLCILCRFPPFRLLS
jgi:hypothetical protein